ncbi:MAG: methionyl-tRNA formyltransferase [Hyphomicrobium sp.]
MSLRLVFMGTPEFSVPSLEAVLKAGHDVVAVYSQPPRQAGRGMDLHKSQIQQHAEKKGLRVLTPQNLKSPIDQEIFKSHNADVAVVVAYGLLLPLPVLESTKYGCFNLHPSLLPRWRGAAPIQRAIMTGDTKTAVMIMRMEQGLDTGPITAQKKIDISGDITSGELHKILALEGAILLVKVLNDIEKGECVLEPQSETGVLYAPKIDKKEAKLDFSKPSIIVHNLVRGLSPFPGAWMEVKTASGSIERVKVLRSQIVEGTAEPGTLIDGTFKIACLEGAIQILEVQRAGKRSMTALEFLRGCPLKEGSKINQV